LSPRAELASFLSHRGGGLIGFDSSEDQDVGRNGTQREDGGGERRFGRESAAAEPAGDVERAVGRSMPGRSVTWLQRQRPSKSPSAAPKRMLTATKPAVDQAASRIEIAWASRCRTSTSISSSATRPATSAIHQTKVKCGAIAHPAPRGVSGTSGGTSG
jgi:hypothetical protein